MYKPLTPVSMGTTPPVAEAGLVLGDFRLVELLGAGGMGEVWRAENARVSRIVRAIKVIRPHLAQMLDFRQRFLREAEILDLLQHPNILRVDNVSEQDGILFMVMELLSGIPGGDLVREQDGESPEGIEVARAARIVREAAQGVAWAHENGVVHRDLKPGNLFVTTSGLVKVLDFGIARGGDTARVTATGAGQPATPAYLAPEVAQGVAPSPASDVYALGVTLFELLTGAPPFHSEPGQTPEQAAMSIMFQHVHRPMPDVRDLRPEVPTALARVLAAATAKNPAKRYPHAGALLVALAPLAPEPLPPLEAGRMGSPQHARPRPPVAPARNPTPPRDQAESWESRVPDASHELEESPARRERRSVPESLSDSLPYAPNDRVLRMQRQRNQILIVVALIVFVIVGIVFASRSQPPAPQRDPPAPAPEPLPRPAPPAPAPPAPAPVRPIVPAPVAPDGMALIPGGTFQQGRPLYDTADALDVPPHTVTVATFAIEKTEVTVDSFRAFAQEHPATLPWPPSLKDFSIIGKLPVVSVSHADAERYCRWKYKDGRLPTEAEWEWAARAPDGRLYPWGSDFRKRCVNGMNGTDGVLEAPGGRPCGATAAGLLDMSGNAWEWTSSPPSLYPGSNGKLPPTTAGAFVARGGSFSNTDQDDLTGTIRVFLPGPNRFTGFRCAVGTRPAGE